MSKMSDRVTQYLQLMNEQEELNTHIIDTKFALEMLDDELDCLLQEMDKVWLSMTDEEKHIIKEV